MKKIILASKSPRRKELLEKCNLSFVCEPADIDETLKQDLSLQDAVKELSYRKANAILEIIYEIAKLHPCSCNGCFFAIILTFGVEENKNSFKRHK